MLESEMVESNAKTVFTSRRFAVEHRHVHMRDGRVVERDVVVHPGAVVILPILDDGRVVMIRHLRHAVGERLLELPAGTREAGEPPATTAARELEEETGYRASVLEPLASFYTTPGFTNELMHAFEARGLTPSEQRLESDEDIIVEIMQADGLLEMLREGELRDGKTIAVLATYLLRRGR